MQYQIFELTPRGVLGGLMVKPKAGLVVTVDPGVYNFQGGVELTEVTTPTDVDFAGKVPGTGTAVVAIYANPDGSISLTPEAAQTPGYQRWGSVDNAEDHLQGRSIKIAEVTLAAGTATITQAMISIKCRFQFDKQRTDMKGLINVRTEQNNIAF